MAYDPNCLDLAQHFLGDLVSNDLASKLAQHIQDKVEAWIAFQDFVKNARIKRQRQRRKR